MTRMSFFLLLEQNSKSNKLEEYGLCFLCAAQKNDKAWADVPSQDLSI